MPKEKSEEWQHVIILDNNDNNTFSKLCCIYCDKKFQGGISRIRGHLIGDHKAEISKCCKVPSQVRDLLREQQCNRIDDKAKRRKIDALDKVTMCVSKKQVTISSMFTNAMTDDADKAVARLFYACGIPFHIADSPYFKAAITSLTKCDSSYTAPNRQKISTKMLDDEVNEIEKYLSSFKTEASKYGVTLVSDGWTNIQMKPIINFLAATPNGCIFINALDVSGQVKDGSFLADEVSKSIESFGKESIVQVVTDSASNCVAARNILEQRYPQIVFSPCTAHCLNLLLEDIGKIPWIHSIISDSKNVVKFITTHHYSLACFRNHSNKELLKPGQTRFATNLIMLQRLSEVKDALQETVISRQYKQWITEALYKNKGEVITTIILNDVFWKSVEKIVNFCNPIIELLRLSDGIVPCVGKVYWKMLQIEQFIEVADLEAMQKRTILALVKDRWRMLHTDLHAAGFVLDPEYNHLLKHQNEEVITGLHAMIERIFINDIQLQVRAVQQHATFRAQQGLFARPMAIAAAKEMPAYAWWMSFGAHVPQLQQVAIRVLAQVTSASASERNWSTFEFIHSKKRNRLKCKRVRDVVFVHANLRLKDKLENINYMEETIEYGNESSEEDDNE